MGLLMPFTFRTNPYLGGLNMHMQKRFVTIIIFLILALPPTLSKAQTTDTQATDTATTEEPGGIDEVIAVTARKREQSIYEVPSQVTVFSPEEIERQGVRNIIDIGKFVPNLNITTFSAGSPAAANPFIRGIGLQDHLIFTDPGVGIYLDGVYLGRQIGQNWNLANIERVEVMRGPQGTFLGRNSIGGAINIITRKPDDTKQFADIAIEGGVRDRLNANFYNNTPLNENLALSLNIALKMRGGIGEFKNISDPDRDVGEIKDLSGRLAALWFPVDGLSFLFAVDGNSGQYGLNPYTTRYQENLDNNGPGNSDVSPDPYNNNTGDEELASSDNSSHGFSLTTEWEVSDDIETKLILSQRRSDYQAGLDDDSALQQYYSFPEEGYANQQSAELQVNASLYPLDIVAGLYYFKEEGQNVQQEPIFQGFSGYLYTRQEVESKSLYTNIGWTLLEKLRLSAGLRFTEDRKEGRAKINDNFDESGDKTWKEWSWDFALSYKVNQSMTAYINVANGYQSGTFPARPYCFFNDPPCIPLTAGDNITAINYETGIKGKFAGAVMLSASVFLTDYSNLPYQKSNTDSGGFSTDNVIIDQQSMGVEVESRIRFARYFSLQMNAGYIETDPNNSDVVVPLTPSFTATVSPEFRFFTKNRGIITLRADYSYRGDMYGGPVSKFKSLSRIDSRQLINFDFGYTTADERWRFGIYGRNITDERYKNGVVVTENYILDIFSNDPSEFGLRLAHSF